jgi:uncharacterized protein YdaU (DUF1376 family)
MEGGLSSPAYIPLFPADYLGDTQHLSTEEHGAYLLLMMTAWTQDDCGLPDDDRKLARIVRLSLRKWKLMRPTMLEFWTVRDGRWSNPRLSKERVYADQKSASNRENARTRWSKQRVENKRSESCDRISERNAPQPQHIDIPNGISPPIAPHGENEPEKPAPKKRKAKPPPAEFDLPEWIPKEPWDQFIEMRRERDKTPTVNAMFLLANRLGKLRDEGHAPAVVLDQSTRNNWIDIYPVKEDRSHERHAAPGRTPDRRDGYDHRDGFERALDDVIYGDHEGAPDG